MQAVRYPKSARLRVRAEFQACYAQGKRYHSAHYIVFVLPSSDHSDPLFPCRTGASVSKKVGNAVVRNRLKRILREFFRFHLSCKPHAFDICIVAKKCVGELPDLRLTEAELCPLFERIFHAP
ncbi:MAG: ribonuclease P protein component [Desulfovibrio sp.]|nr:ribonuclease P protein component [Desulfovibrio sp.]